ncbi:MAG: protein kinase domain-containing protein [Spirulinaceae cyanobacterium]
MEILCTRPSCPSPRNFFDDLDDESTLKTAQQKYCTSCGMPLILGGRYLPSKLLGQGGFGAAFLAGDRYTTSFRNCVVKQFQPSGNLSQQQLETAQRLFEREAAVLEELGQEHRHIPNSYAFFPVIVPKLQGSGEQSFFYLVQEYIDGADLEREQAQRGRAYTEQEVRQILQEILEILKFVHDRDAIHRDIKPSNIMRSRRDPRSGTLSGRLYLLDFGAVKQVTAGVGSTQGRSTGIYSMGFAPPEQMQGSQVYPSTDLYALAATCLVLLTNKAPEDLYDGYNNAWDWRNHATQVSDQLESVLNRMLRSTPKDRFQSAQEVLEALKATQTAIQPPPQPITQPPPPAPNPPRPQSVKVNPSPPPVPRAATRIPSGSQVSTVKLIGSAAFTGFEGALLFLAFSSLFGTPAISMGLWGVTMGGLVYAQFRSIISGSDLPILAVLTAVVMLWPALRGDLAFPTTLVIAVLVGAGAIALIAIFRLIYLTLSRIL